MRGILRFLKWGAVVVIVAYVGLWGMIFYSMSDTALISSAQDAVRDRLADPESAVFRSVGVYESGSMREVCGEVNARNRMGGMNGFAAFVYIPANSSGPSRVLISGTASAPYGISAHCGLN